MSDMKRFLNTHVIERWGGNTRGRRPGETDEEYRLRRRHFGSRNKQRMRELTREARKAQILRLHDSQRDPLTHNFRLAIREMMNKEEIKALIEDRFVKELRGEVPPLVVPECFATARTTANESLAIRSRGHVAVNYPNDDIFVGWTTDEKVVFAKDGTVPERFKR